jgi:Flp pilus assembly protein TadD
MAEQESTGSPSAAGEAADDLDELTEEQIEKFLLGEGEIDGDTIQQLEGRALTREELDEAIAEAGSLSEVLAQMYEAGVAEMQAEEPEPPEQLIVPERVEQWLKGEMTLAQLEGLDEDTVYEMADMGYSLFEAGRLGDAQALFEGLEVYNPCDPYFHQMLGAIYQRQNQAELARSQYETALQIEPDNIETLTNLGEVMIELGKPVEAAPHLQKAVELDDGAGNPSALRAAGLASVLVEVAQEAAS